MHGRLHGLGYGLIALLVAACHGPKPAPGHARALPAALDPVPVPVVTEASVVAFWLAGADTLAAAARGAAREEFLRSNALVGRYLSDTDIALVATVADTVVVSLTGGFRRVLTLSGLDYPYGYVFVEPGYAEEYHTGISEQADLEAAIDDYFGLEDQSPAPRHRIALRSHGQSVPTLLDILSRGREGSALRNRNLDARVSSAALWRRGCARCAWLRRDARRRSGAPARPLSRSR